MNKKNYSKDQHRVRSRTGAQVLCFLLALVLIGSVAVPFFVSALGRTDTGLEDRNRKAFVEAGLPEQKAEAVADRLSKLGCQEVVNIFSDEADYGNWAMQVYDVDGKAWTVIVDALGTLLTIEPLDPES